jgi:hypothetical protein
MSDYINQIRDHVEWGRGPNDLDLTDWRRLLELFIGERDESGLVDIVSNLDREQSIGIAQAIGRYLREYDAIAAYSLCSKISGHVLDGYKDTIKADFNRIAEQYRQEVADDMAAGIN